jgi:type IV pilus assembly protein PilO
MALLPQEPRRQVALLLSILAFAAGYAGYEYLYRSQSEALDQLERRVQNLQDQNRRAQLLITRGESELEERVAIYERHLERMESLIPAEEEVATLLAAITAEANRFGVSMGSLRPEVSSDQGIYTLESYQLSVIGEYHRVGQFLTRIASLPRIMNPTALDLSPFSGPAPPGDQAHPVLASFRIETYQAPLPEGFGAPSAAGEGS